MSSEVETSLGITNKRFLDKLGMTETLREVASIAVVILSGVEGSLMRRCVTQLSRA